MLEKIKEKFTSFKGNSDSTFVGGLFLRFSSSSTVHKRLVELTSGHKHCYFSADSSNHNLPQRSFRIFCFPHTVLLAVTLYRLGLNVASTRLILLDGDAGGVIEAFGSFVVRGNYVGTVIFLILVIINFVVITKGAGRIAEVTARFTLDAMPGKQMSIDAEMQNGVITEAQALAKRERLQKEADFYGSMDGASKFVRGDAIAELL